MARWRSDDDEKIAGQHDSSRVDRDFGRLGGRGRETGCRPGDAAHAHPCEHPRCEPRGVPVVITDAPIFLTPDDRRVPFVIAKQGSRLDLLVESEDWYNVEFLDQYGRRVGYIQSQYVRDAALVAPAGAAQRVELVLVHVLAASERAADAQDSLRDLVRDLKKRKSVLLLVDSPEHADVIVELLGTNYQDTGKQITTAHPVGDGFRAVQGVRAKLMAHDYSTELGGSSQRLSNLHHLGDAIERWIKDNRVHLLKRHPSP